MNRMCVALSVVSNLCQLDCLVSNSKFLSYCKLVTPLCVALFRGNNSNISVTMFLFHSTQLASIAGSFHLGFYFFIIF